MARSFYISYTTTLSSKVGNDPLIIVTAVSSMVHPVA